MRKCEIYQHNQWIEIPFDTLKEGNIFRLFEDTGTIVMDREQNVLFKAVEDAFLNDEGEWQVYCDATHLIET